MPRRDVIILAIAIAIVAGWLRWQLYVLETAPHAFGH